jgi:chromosome segregation ATPase
MARVIEEVKGLREDIFDDDNGFFNQIFGDQEMPESDVQRLYDLRARDRRGAPKDRTAFQTNHDPSNPFSINLAPIFEGVDGIRHGFQQGRHDLEKYGDEERREEAKKGLAALAESDQVMSAEEEDLRGRISDLEMGYEDGSLHFRDFKDEYDVARERLDMLANKRAKAGEEKQRLQMDKERYTGYARELEDLEARYEEREALKEVRRNIEMNLVGLAVETTWEDRMEKVRDERERKRLRRNAEASEALAQDGHWLKALEEMDFVKMNASVDRVNADYDADIPRFDTLDFLRLQQQLNAELEGKVLENSLSKLNAEASQWDSTRAWMNDRFPNYEVERDRLETFEKLYNDALDSLSSSNTMDHEVMEQLRQRVETYRAMYSEQRDSVHALEQQIKEVGVDEGVNVDFLSTFLSRRAVENESRLRTNLANRLYDAYSGRFPNVSEEILEDVAIRVSLGERATDVLTEHGVNYRTEVGESDGVRRVEYHPADDPDEAGGQISEALSRVTPEESEVDVDALVSQASTSMHPQDRRLASNVMEAYREYQQARQAYDDFKANPPARSTTPAGRDLEARNAPKASHDRALRRLRASVDNLERGTQVQTAQYGIPEPRRSDDQLAARESLAKELRKFINT